MSDHFPSPNMAPTNHKEGMIDHDVHVAMGGSTCMSQQSSRAAKRIGTIAKCTSPLLLTSIYASNRGKPNNRKSASSCKFHIKMAPCTTCRGGFNLAQLACLPGLTSHSQRFSMPGLTPTRYRLSVFIVTHNNRWCTSQEQLLHTIHTFRSWTNMGGLL